MLERSAGQPGLLAETVFREALGDAAWESLPDELKQTVAGTGHAVLAEINGHGMDLSEDALELDEDALAGIRRPTLILSAEDSPEACRLVNARLSGALPFTRTVLVPGGRLINPAHPAVLDFVDRIAAAPTPGPSRDLRSANRAGRESARGPRPLSLVLSLAEP